MTIPKKINKYEIKKVLGEGAMGVVYHGYDPKIGRDVAIKTVHHHLLEGELGEELYQRFTQEVRAVGKLSHPHVVAIYDTDEFFENEGDEKGLPFFVMEFVKGQELEEYIRTGQRFSFRQTIQIVCQILDAFDYTHKLGIIHRDIKPANIFITESGDVKIADFGIARVENSNLTQAGSVLGTPNYMSPEQCTGQVLDQRSDLFSIAVVCYEMLTGEKPFHASSLHAVMHKVVNSPAEPVSALAPGVPASMDAIMGKALAKSPDLRFQSAADFRHALQPFLGSAPAEKDETLIHGTLIKGATASAPITGATAADATQISGSAHTDATNAMAAPRNLALEAGQSAATAAGSTGKKWTAIVSGIAVSLIIALAVILWLNLAKNGLEENGTEVAQADNKSSDTPSTPAPASNLSVEQQEKLDKLLRVAKISEQTGRLVWPPSSNAVYIYRLVLEIDPDNQQASQALIKIAETLQEKAVSLYKQGDYESLQAHLDVSLEAFPDNRLFLQYKEKLQQNGAG